MTNFEKIKNMTVEEMVEFIILKDDCECCKYADDDDACDEFECRDGIKAWLEQEAEND